MKKIKLLAVFFMCTNYFYLFCPGGGLAVSVDAGSTGVGVFNSNFQNHGTGISAHGTGHTIEKCTVTNCSTDGIMIASENTSVKGCVANNNGDTGFRYMVATQSRSNAAYNNDVGFNDLAGSSAYNDVASDNISGNFGGSASNSDFLYGFKGTFSCLGIIKEDLSGVFTAIQDVKVTITNINELAEEIAAQIDTNGTFTMLNAILGLECDVLITQSNIPYTITQPGRYCLAEDVIGANAITISSSDVILDLNNHVLEVDQNTRGITSPFGTVIENIILKNGRIKGGSLSAGISFLYEVIGLKIENIEFSNIGTAIQLNPGTAQPFYDTIIQNCFFINIQNKSIDCAYNDNIIVRGLAVQDGNGVDINIENSTNVQVTDCVMTGSNSTTHIIIGTSDNVDLENCNIAQGNGCSVSDTNNIRINNCLSQNNNNIGFGFNNVSLSIINNTDVETANTGFDISSSSYFEITNCSAVNCSANGFNIDSTYILIRNGTANYAAANGFNLSASSSNCELISSHALNNAGSGINNAGTNNKFFNNVATNNTTDYSGVSVAPFLAASSVTFTNCNYWINISS